MIKGRWTEKKCPGCGKMEEYPPSNGVCFSCRSLIERGLSIQMEQEKSEKTLYRYGYCGVGNHPVDMALNELLMQITENPVHGDSLPWNAGEVVDLKPHYPNSSDPPRTQRLLHKETMNAFVVLVWEVSKALDGEYEKGKRNGASILEGLMEGTLSSKDADEKERWGR